MDNRFRDLASVGHAFGDPGHLGHGCRGRRRSLRARFGNCSGLLNSALGCGSTGAAAEFEDGFVRNGSAPATRHDADQDPNVDHVGSSCSSYSTGTVLGLDCILAPFGRQDGKCEEHQQKHPTVQNASNEPDNAGGFVPEEKDHQGGPEKGKHQQQVRNHTKETRGLLGAVKVDVVVVLAAPATLSFEEAVPVTVNDEKVAASKRNHREDPTQNVETEDCPSVGAKKLGTVVENPVVLLEAGTSERNPAAGPHPVQTKITC